MQLKRKQRVDIYWSFRNPFVNPLEVCEKYKISTFQMQKVVDLFQVQMDKKYMSNLKPKVDIELFCHNLRYYHPELVKTK